MAGWASGSLRGSGLSEDVELESLTNSRRCQVHHVRGRLLSGGEAFEILNRHNTQLIGSRRIMLETLRNMESHDFKFTQQELLVSYLQHVTDEDSMKNIFETGFRIMKKAKTSRPGFKDLLFWSAGVAPEDIETARIMSYENVREVLDLPLYLARRFERKITEQFANSPAFNPSVSRYGNFKFSFPFFSLMEWYQDQHCGGEEPQLRILGTDMYKQEMVHLILVHSPDKNHQFRDLPQVQKEPEGSKSLPFVYEKKGMLYWRPESTSSEMTALISEQGITQCPQYCPFFIEHGSCYHMKVSSMWNHLVFAFHLPNNHCLKVPKGNLLNNLTACSIDKPSLVEESKCLEIEKARDIIQQMKSD